MKTEKLTLEWCFKYPKAKIQMYYRGKETMFFKNISNFFKYDYSKTGYENVIANCKLILKPLSSLTDEEKKTRENLGEWVDDTHAGHFVETVASGDYLRSINIDIDNLQERGLCIYE